MTREIVLCIVLLASLQTRDARADPVTLRFIVSVEHVAGPVIDLFGVPIKVGDSLSGAITYNALLTPSQPPLGGVADYIDPEGSIRLHSLLTIRSIGLSVIDGGGHGTAFSADQLSAGAVSLIVPRFFAVGMSVGFDDDGAAPGTTFTGFALPQSAASWAALPNKGFGLRAWEFNDDEAPPSVESLAACSWTIHLSPCLNQQRFYSSARDSQVWAYDGRGVGHTLTAVEKSADQGQPHISTRADSSPSASTLLPAPSRPTATSLAPGRGTVCLSRSCKLGTLNP